MPIALALTVLAGCATRPEPARETRPPLTPRPDIVASFPVPGLRERMISLARQEWEIFGRPVVIEEEPKPRLEPTGQPAPERTDAPTAPDARPELHTTLLARVLMYWYAVTRQPVVGFTGELQPWSAAFIAWLAQNAGMTADEFPRTVAHWGYIRRFVQPRDGAPFVARDPRDYSPRPGDLVCNSRNSGARPAFTETVPSFEQLEPGPYHCDLVVTAVSGVFVEAIGGNVRDAVSLSRLAVDGAGRLRPKAAGPWVVVLEQREH